MIDLLFTILQFIYNGIVTIFEVIVNIPYYINVVSSWFILFPFMQTFRILVLTVAIIIKIKRLVL